jgi:hypothetical protein
MSPKKKWLVQFSLLGAISLGACSGLFVSPEGRVATQTAKAMDHIGQQTLEALRMTEEAGQSLLLESQATNTELPATGTSLPSATPWPEPVRIEVSIDTNCRSGPGPAFPMIGALMVGESSIVRARVLEMDYWIIENPDNPGRECWLWGRHAVLEGETNHLPVATPPWTATPEPGIIAGWVFVDANQNGAWDEGSDTPLEGITLYLRVGACPGSSGVAMVDTNGQGRYEITGLFPTLYCLARDESEQLYPNTWTINLRAGQTRDEINFWHTP